MANQDHTITRKTRFVCISDTHNCGGAFKIPPGDVLIHAGDLTNQGSYPELKKAVDWLEILHGFEVKIVIAGNHDIMLDSAHQSDSIAQDISRCQDLFKNSTSITYLNHEATAINLNRGPHTTFKIFGSPYSPEIDTKWAFGYKSDEEASLLWDKIPTETDIVLTHTPPKNHLDQRKDGIPVGCAELQNALQRIRPHLHICGHVHESRGGEQIQWDPESQKEFSTDKWNDPGIGNKKLSFLDLTSKSSQSLNWLDQNGEVPTTGPRNETYIINAAIMASSWPHPGGKKFNKPIVIDLNLPVWE